MPQDISKKLTDQEIDDLANFLGNTPGAMSLEAVDGFFAALACSPEMILPSTFLSHVWGEDHEFEDTKQAEKYTIQVLRHWNQANSMAANDELYDCIFEENDNYGTEWAKGFMRGIKLCGESWLYISGDEDRVTFLHPILLLAYEDAADPSLRTGPLDDEMREKLVSAIPTCVPKLNKMFEPLRQSAYSQVDKALNRKTSKKIGRNEPCPCKSGKKYKHCCGKN